MTSDNILWDSQQFDLDGDNTINNLPLLDNQRPEDYNLCGEYIGVIFDVVDKDNLSLKGGVI